jgi:hypothetical protein
MKTDTNIAANAERGVQTEDFAERVRVNQTKLISQLRPHYDFISPVTPSGIGFEALHTSI